MDGMTLRTLKEDGYKAVFIGIGKKSSVSRVSSPR